MRNSPCRGVALLTLALVGAGLGGCVGSIAEPGADEEPASDAPIASTASGDRRRAGAAPAAGGSPSTSASASASASASPAPGGAGLPPAPAAPPTPPGSVAPAPTPPGAAAPLPPPSSAQAPAPLPPPGAAPSFIRRLSNRELGNAIAALTGLRPAALAALPPDAHDHTYDRVAEGQTVSMAHVEGALAVAAALAESLTPDRLGALVPACATPGALPPDGAALATARRPCVERLIDDLAPRAFRRPLAPEKRTGLLALYDDAGTYQEGLSQVVAGIFAALEFLYLVEPGTPVDGLPGVLALDDHALAARLSFSLCETLPDPPLAAAAAAGELRRPEALAAHAERLLALPCARATALHLFESWLHLDAVPELVRDAQAFPQFGPATREAMARESAKVIDTVLWETPGSLADLFSTSFTFVDRELAPIYGMTTAPAAPERLQLPAFRRGILTQPSVLAVTSEPLATSPVERGTFVVRRLLCGELPSPPQDLEIVVPPMDPTVTTRERWARHSSDPACAACHRVIDPVGFAMEDFDPIGRHRTTENGRPIDAVGGVPSIGIEPGSVRGGAELSVALAGSRPLADCFARNLLRHTLGRLEGAEDARTLAELSASLAKGTPLRQVMAAATTTFSFRHRGTRP